MTGFAQLKNIILIKETDGEEEGEKEKQKKGLTKRFYN